MIRRRLAEAQSNLISLAEKFIDNTLEFAQRKRVCAWGCGVSALETKIAGRHVVVVVRATITGPTFILSGPTLPTSNQS